MVRLRILCPVNGWKVTGSSVAFIAFVVTLSKLKSDGLLTVARAMIMIILTFLTSKVSAQTLTISST